MHGKLTFTFALGLSLSSLWMFYMYCISCKVNDQLANCTIYIYIPRSFLQDVQNVQGGKE